MRTAGWSCGPRARSPSCGSWSRPRPGRSLLPVVRYDRRGRGACSWGECPRVARRVELPGAFCRFRVGHPQGSIAHARHHRLRRSEGSARTSSWSGLRAPGVPQATIPPASPCWRTRVRASRPPAPSGTSRSCVTPPGTTTPRRRRASAAPGGRRTARSPRRTRTRTSSQQRRGRGRARTGSSRTTSTCGRSSPGRGRRVHAAETDTEVIPHLIEPGLRPADIAEAVRERRARGSRATTRSSRCPRGRAGPAGRRPAWSARWSSGVGDGERILRVGDPGIPA